MPLTLAQLQAFFMGAWSLFEVLEMNFADNRYDLDEMQRFVGFDSQFYPQFGQLFRRRIEAFAAEHAVEDDPDEDSLLEGAQS